jgi:CheY-like chemotaxis protein
MALDDNDAAAQQRVLVVDDDAAVGQAVRLALRPRQVTFAQSAVGALARIAAGGKFDAIVCDLHMPGMTGMQFEDEVRKISPEAADRIVFITGAAATKEATDFLARTKNPCLEKPFEREVLRAAVSAAARRQR